MTSSSLVLAAHGTRSDSGHELFVALTERVAASVGPEVEVGLGFVDVREPDLADVIARAAHPPLVAPLFLSAGTHVHHDVATAAQQRAGAAVLPLLGARSVIVQLHQQALAGSEQTGDQSSAPVALLAAGSADPRAREDVADVAGLLERATGRVVRVGFLSGPGPSAPEALEGATQVLAHLLAPGHFADRAEAIATDRDLPCTAPLLASPVGFEAIAQDLADQRTGSRLTPRWKLERNHAG